MWIFTIQNMKIVIEDERILSTSRLQNKRKIDEKEEVISCQLKVEQENVGILSIGNRQRSRGLSVQIK